MTLGILGGMGGLASAELVHTLYRLNPANPEQTGPVVLLYSDPSIPDRTAAILTGNTEEVSLRLTYGLSRLVEMGAQRLVMACFTAHYVVSSLPADLQSRLLSLLDILCDEVACHTARYLVLCTSGTRRARIFESHRRWHELAPLVEFLVPEDQDRLHACLYELKHRPPEMEDLAWFDQLLEKYGVDGLLFGCSELHLLQRPYALRGGVPRIVDPLQIIARNFHLQKNSLP